MRKYFVCWHFNLDNIHYHYINNNNNIRLLKINKPQFKHRNAKS